MRPLLLALLSILVACGSAGGPGKKSTTTEPTGPDALCMPEPYVDTWTCALDPDDLPHSAPELGCVQDFELMASLPLDGSISGAVSVKFVIDRIDGDRLYFINSKCYPLHWDFVNAFLTQPPLPSMDLSTFNEQTYADPNRRFLVGVVTWYQEADVWAFELAPYDTAGPDLTYLAYDALRRNSFLDDRLQFHPSSGLQADNAADLPADVCVISTERLFEGIKFQPLNLGESTGRLIFRTAEEVDGVPIDFRSIVVLDAVPNDIGITAGIITDAYQTPLSHINVLSQNRGTPNMVLIDSYEDPALRAMEDQWVRLEVGPFEYSIEPISFEEAEAWWIENRPEPLESEPPDLTVRELTLAEHILGFDPDNLPDFRYGTELADAIHRTIPAFGGKATHFGGLALIDLHQLQHVYTGDPEDYVPLVPTPDGFGVPIARYWDFMEANGFNDRIRSWHDPTHPDYDPQFAADAQYRQDKLHELQADMIAAPHTPDFLVDIRAILDRPEYNPPGGPRVRMRFRSSTNAEDLGTFTGAGLYTSNAGTLDDPDEPALTAIKATWASVWNPRAYDERAYYGIDQLNVGMALLSHPSFPAEEVNGVAITNNIFDPSGLEPAFYINAQVDGWSVVLPELGVQSEAILYFFDRTGQPATYYGDSSLIPKGYRVLDSEQLYRLGTALKAIQTFFYPVYGDREFYAMDTEFKFDDDGVVDGYRHLYMKQARPYPGRGEADTGPAGCTL